MGKSKVSYKKLNAFAKRLGKEEYRSKLNYFRLLEYPVTLSLLEVKEGMKVLDVGSGFVSLPPLWMAAERKAVVTAVDIKPYTQTNRKHIEDLKKRIDIPADNLQILSADAANLPSPDGSFDRVSAISFLEHLESFADALVMQELGRVLKPGGFLVLSVPFNLGKHIEEEKWGGEGYEQRHYTDVTLRERLIHPSRLHFVKAIVFGERDPEVGKQVIGMEEEKRLAFTEQASVKPERYWEEFYRVEGDQFVVNRDLLPEKKWKAAGVVAVLLQKRSEKLPESYFAYDPLESWRHSNYLTRNQDNSSHWLTIDQVKILNLFGDAVSTVNSGESLRVLIDFHASGPVNDPVFRIFFHNREGEVVAGLHTGRTGFLAGSVEGTHTMEIKIGMLNLTGGSYGITVGAWDRDHPDPIPPVPYDVRYLKSKVDVHPRKTGCEGHVYLPYEIKMS